MNLYELTDILKKHSTAPLEIMLPSGELVPEHFHVTEIGRVQKDFIDCGGKLHRMVRCVIQVWVADDVKHRLKPGKLNDIITKSRAAVNFMDGDLTVYVEYGEEAAALYRLEDVEITGAGLLFMLSGNKTDCLAKDKCGVAGCC